MRNAEQSSRAGAKSTAGRTESIFEKASRVFDGWTDPETGVRMLRIYRRGESEAGAVRQTPYHQFRCFLEGGRKVLLWGHDNQPGTRGHLLDLTTGEYDNPFPAGYRPREAMDHSSTALLHGRSGSESCIAIWDLKAGRALASASNDGWNHAGSVLLSDGRRALFALSKGKPYNEPVQSRMLLVQPGEAPRVIFEADGFSCNHMQGCPTEPDLFAYDRWPSPHRNVDQVTTLCTVDGKYHEQVKLAPEALRPVVMWGVRDHYVWTPDGRRIVSYLFPHPLEAQAKFNHFEFQWWLSVLDRRTGEDLSAKYPPGRWGGHMQVTPDSCYILCCGGPGFDKLFVVDIEKLRHGWNEHVICSYPKTVSKGTNSDPFPYPFALPDGSGVIFNAGWPGPEHGVYLAEWPSSLAS